MEGGATPPAVVNAEVEQRSTEAARAYVLVARDRIRAEIARHGARALERPSCQRLQRSIAAEELQRTWPLADLQAALAD
jgi:hypothetical protein